MNNKSILVAGDIMLDIYHFGGVNRISPEAPVPVFLDNGKSKNVPGGAANVAVNLAAIDVKTRLFSVCGKDSTGIELTKLLEINGVETKYIGLLDNRKTTSKLRYIGPNNQQLLRVDTEDTADVETGEVKELFEKLDSDISDIGIILVSDYKKGLLTEEICQALIHLGKKNNIPVLIDVKDKNISKYKGAYLIKPNRKELSELTEMPVSSLDDAEKAAKYLCKVAECEYVLTTLGAEGMLLVNEQGRVAYSKSMAREVFDVTGAGDTSIAYLATEILKGNDILEAVKVANYAASVQVSKVGTSIVYPHEVKAAMYSRITELSDKVLDYYNKAGINIILRNKEQNKKIIFTNGCFDILHAGHVTYLKKARELGDLLVVGLNSDSSVKKLKGDSRPINTLNDRALLLAALEFVDYVVPFEEETPYELIKAIIPDILVKGGDYNTENIVGRDIVEKNGGLVTIIPMVEGKSTTKILKKIEGQHHANS